MKETMASSLWKKLEDKYMTKSIENRLYLKKKLFRFQYKKGISMIEHLDNYNKILVDLQNLDVEISDEDKALLLLNSLPETYEHLTTTLLYGKDEVKFIDVSNALVNNEYQKKDQLDHRDSTSEALTVARGRTNNRRSEVPSERGRSCLKSREPSRSKPKGESSFRRPVKDECAYCHQKGHWKKDCPNKDKSNVNVAKALVYASHIVNRLPASALDGKTPKDVWSRQPVSDYGRLHIFGCPAYFHVTKSKLDPRAKKAVFVGFSEGVKGFGLWNSESKKIILSQDVTFDKSAMLKQIPRGTENENPNSLQQVEFETLKKSEKASPTVDHPDDEFDDQDEISVEMEDSTPVPEIRQQPKSIATSRLKRDIRRPTRYIDMVAYALPVTDDDVPSLKASSSVRDVSFGKQVHVHVIKSGYLSSVFVGSALIDLYAKSSSVGDAKVVFDEIPVKNSVCANALLSGYCEAKLWDEMLELVRLMPALKLEYDNFTLSAMLRACAGLSGIEFGRQAHAYLIRKFDDMVNDVFVQSSLIEMYGKCGLVWKALQVFDLAGHEQGERSKDVVLWTSMLGVYGRNRHFNEVIQLFEAMLIAGTEPDGVAFVTVISACGHTGQVKLGVEYFESMIRDYKLDPGPEHYSCLIDLHCRAGELDKAWKLINEMLHKRHGSDSVSMWGALLSSCYDHGNFELGKLAAQKALELDPQNVGVYVMLSNLYAKFNMWDEIGRLREVMKQKGLKKDVGCSWIEVSTCHD
ncbi:hypothetical protein LWI29_038519 [Acer saccharum]|uniref:CCHC-type domain-containing protein n=1 Tax=Acer saccharum TaxID=4024 RepID=A0AA39S6F9_ACESA|nr:hypothetical protein LWI29_038519 [Acer saccharum]